MDHTPTTKDSILERIEAAANAIDEVVAGMTDEQLLRGKADGGWSGRDILAHLAADLRWFTAQFEALLEEREPTAAEAFTSSAPPDPRFNLSTQDGRNAAQYEMNRHLSLDEVRQRFAEYRKRAANAIARIPADQFNKQYTIVPLQHMMQVRPARDGEEGWPLWRWISGNTWHHFEDHLKDLEVAARH